MRLFGPEYKSFHDRSTTDVYYRVIVLTTQNNALV